MEPRAAVVVMAKRPVAGAVKTRLGPALDPEQAAELYAAMLADRCAQVARVPGVVRAIAVADHDDTEPIEGLVPEGFEVAPQPPGGLGEGLRTAAERYLARGLPVLLVDSDSPLLPQALLEEAVDRIAGSRGGRWDLVIGPSEDGGYWAIGLSAPRPELFEDVPWSTSRVTEVTLERARAAGLETHVLPTAWDVDTPDTVDRLERELLDRTWPPRTAAWLRARRHRRWRASSAPGATSTEAHWSARWERLGSRPVYATPWLSIREDRVRMPDGNPSIYTVVDCGQCVGVLPLVDEDTVLMVRQYRYVAERVTWEMPTGGVHGGEDVETAVRRELAEEAGMAAGMLTRLGAYHTSKSVMDETAHLFVARSLRPASAEGDETEFIRAEPLPFARVLEMVLSGEIVDSMTIIAVLREAHARRSG